MNWNVLVLCVNPVGFPQCQYFSRGRCLLGAKRVLGSLFCFWTRLLYKYEETPSILFWNCLPHRTFSDLLAIKKRRISAASFLNYSVSSFISVANPNIIKCIITIILSLIPAIYVFFFRIHTEPNLQQIDNINSSKLLLVGNLFIIGYIVFHV